MAFHDVNRVAFLPAKPPQKIPEVNLADLKMYLK
jgi:hypothetical protein